MPAGCLEQLPPEFQPYKTQLSATLQPFLAIQATPGHTTLSQSKFLGLPYLPQGQEYPHDIDGVPMLLLAQINFEQIPRLPEFPTHGLLQIFISTHHEFYGADLDSFESMQVQNDFQVRYFEQIAEPSEWTEDFTFLRRSLANREIIVPMEQECQLSFQSQESIISPTDYRFENILGHNFFAQFGEEQEETQELYWQMFSAQGHRMGGHAFFTESDPRCHQAQDEEWVLLLQIDSDETAGIMWGDLGVGHFFIPRSNLKRLDFSRILYTWDCG